MELYCLNRAFGSCNQIFDLIRLLKFELTHKMKNYSISFVISLNRLNNIVIDLA